MSTLAILQVALNILFFAGIGLILAKVRRRREEDPRLSYGLKVLQNKISILEDLSDKTEQQVKQLMGIIDSKVKDLQLRLQYSDQQLQRIDQAMSKTMEVAHIFENRVPHEEILERKVSNKYINAARMAHQGFNLEQIQQQIDLPKAELDFIIKVNKEQLMFNEEHLPAWTKQNPLQPNPALFEAPQVNLTELERLGNEFRKACKDFEQKTHPATKPTPSMLEYAGEDTSTDLTAQEQVVPYQFKKYSDIR